MCSGVRNNGVFTALLCSILLTTSSCRELAEAHACDCNLKGFRISAPLQLQQHLIMAWAEYKNSTSSCHYGRALAALGSLFGALLHSRCSYTAFRMLLF